MNVHVWSRLGLRWKLLGAIGTVLVLAGGAGAFGVWRLNDGLNRYDDLVSGTMGASQLAAVISFDFVSRHKVLKDVYLFNTDAAKVQSATQEVNDWTAKSAAGLERLNASPVLTTEDRDLIATAQAAQKEYQAASNAAIARATAAATRTRRSKRPRRRQGCRRFSPHPRSSRARLRGGRGVGEYRGDERAGGRDVGAGAGAGVDGRGAAGDGWPLPARRACVERDPAAPRRLRTGGCKFTCNH